MPDTSDTSDTNTTRVWHECCPNYTNATRVRNFNFDNYTTFAPLYWHGQEKFHSENYFLEIPSSYAKMRLKSAPQKVNFVMAKAISKSYKVDCGCKCPFTFPHSYEASFLKKYLMWHYQHFFCKNLWKLGKMNARF